MTALRHKGMRKLTSMRQTNRVCQLGLRSEQRAFLAPRAHLAQLAACGGPQPASFAAQGVPGQTDEGVSCSQRPLAQLTAFGGGSSLAPAQWSLRKPLRLPHWCSERRRIFARSCAMGAAKRPSAAAMSGLRGSGRSSLAGEQGVLENAVCSPQQDYRGLRRLPREADITSR